MHFIEKCVFLTIENFILHLQMVLGTYNKPNMK